MTGRARVNIAANGVRECICGQGPVKPTCEVCATASASRWNWSIHKVWHKNV
jgi:hypothetical protein